MNDPSTITAKTGHPYVRSKLAAEDAVRRSEQRYRALIEVTATG